MYVLHSNTDQRRWGRCSMCTCISQMTCICLFIQQRKLNTDLSLGEIVKNIQWSYTNRAPNWLSLLICLIDLRQCALNWPGSTSSTKCVSIHVCLTFKCGLTSVGKMRNVYMYNSNDIHMFVHSKTPIKCWNHATEKSASQAATRNQIH